MAVIRLVLYFFRQWNLFRVALYGGRKIIQLTEGRKEEVRGSCEDIPFCMVIESRWYNDQKEYYRGCAKFINDETKCRGPWRYRSLIRSENRLASIVSILCLLFVSTGLISHWPLWFHINQKWKQLFYVGIITPAKTVNDEMMTDMLNCYEYSQYDKVNFANITAKSEYFSFILIILL